MARPVRIDASDARAIIEYNHAVFDRFVRRIRRLPEKEATRARGIGHESLFDTLVHILNAQEVWLVYIVRGRNTDKVLGALFRDSTRHPKTWKEFDVYARHVRTGVEDTVRWLNPRNLSRTVKAFWMPGHYTVRDAVFQTTFEEAHHLGEIIGALWQDDRRSPDMTWIDVRRAKPRKSTRRVG
ncbi:MAG: DinB family protein [Thermoplasmata archaeon]